ncbi:hypothetical protein ONT16_02580 [Prevotella copri]|uniref:Uncharacterized protein n=1 Tax=Segatella copri TaxID=165179 RepID=A0AAP3BC04_9BACT|nr:hypothetical protein [Segatella copri]MCW4127171.1 hypothetical protein [Segatella copri]MCW4414132.1 hypothetical protein [Segatella copri]MCW4420531.1 hypothetical protein [Segatella copri]
MRQLILHIIFLMSMVFTGYGEVSAASVSLSHQDSLIVETADATHNKDRLAKVTPHQQEQEAQLEDASNAAYRVCSSRPQRLLPSGNIHGNPSANSRLLTHRIRFLSSLLSVIEGAMEPFRQETAPIHFDVASKYYVICLRHLIC